MTIHLLFWLLMLAWLLFGIVSVWPEQGQPLRRSHAGFSLLLFVLLLILGWKAFGPPIKF